MPAKRSSQLTISEWPSLEIHVCGKEGFLSTNRGDSSGQLLGGERTLPAVIEVHVHKRGNMKLLGVLKAPVPRLDCQRGVEQIAVSFSPGGVRDFRDNMFKSFAIGSEAIVQVERAEIVAPIAKLRQQSDWTSANFAAYAVDPVADLFIERSSGTLAMIAFQKCQRRESVAAQQPQRAHQVGQLGQIQISHRYRVSERMTYRAGTSVRDVAAIQGAVHVSSSRPNFSATFNPLIKPSS